MFVVPSASCRVTVSYTFSDVLLALTFTAMVSLPLPLILLSWMRLGSDAVAVQGWLAKIARLKVPPSHGTVRSDWESANVPGATRERLSNVL